MLKRISCLLFVFVFLGGFKSLEAKPDLTDKQMKMVRKLKSSNESVRASSLEHVCFLNREQQVKIYADHLKAKLEAEVVKIAPGEEATINYFRERLKEHQNDYVKVMEEYFPQHIDPSDRKFNYLIYFSKSYGATKELKALEQIQKDYFFKGLRVYLVCPPIVARTKVRGFNPKCSGDEPFDITMKARSLEKFQAQMKAMKEQKHLSIPSIAIGTDINSWIKRHKLSHELLVNKDKIDMVYVNKKGELVWQGAYEHSPYYFKPFLEKTYSWKDLKRSDDYLASYKEYGRLQKSGRKEDLLKQQQDVEKIPEAFDKCPEYCIEVMNSEMRKEAFDFKSMSLALSCARRASLFTEGKFQSVEAQLALAEFESGNLDKAIMLTERELNKLKSISAPPKDQQFFIDRLKAWKGIKTSKGAQAFARGKKALNLFSEVYWPALKMKQTDVIQKTEGEVLAGLTEFREEGAEILFTVLENKRIFKENEDRIKNFAVKLLKKMPGDLTSKNAKEHRVFAAHGIYYFRLKNKAKGVEMFKKALKFNPPVSYKVNYEAYIAYLERL